MTTHTSTMRFTGGMSFEAGIDQHTVRISGNEDAPSPKKLLLVSLAGCTGIDVVSLLNKMRVEFSDFSIETSANLTDEHPRVYDRMSIIYKIKVAEADRDKVEKAVNLSKEKYCGVSAMFRKFADISFSIQYL